MEKTRNLSTAEYFLQIQREYLLAEFRRKIYYKPSDKRYYSKVMNFKAEKINSISLRNKLDSILNSNQKREHLKSELFDRFGKPLFDLTEEDQKNYYLVGNEFSYENDIWILDEVKQDGRLVLYNKFLQKFETVEKCEVCRIF